MTYFVVGFILGVLLGAAIVLAVVHVRSRAAEQQTRETFAALAAEALDANARRLGEQALTALDAKKALVDQAILAVNDRLENVRQFLQAIEAERKHDLGNLGGSVASLSVTAGKLHEMLASTQRRGAWGERMAEDVLRLAGLQEGINYLKQSSADAEDGRADFTFLLPNDLKVNMDVKFPLENYKAYLDAADDAARSACVRDLCKAVQGHVRAVAARGYIDPNVPTVPYVLMFIPSEQIYSLVMECQKDLIDEALSRKVVPCSPLTLYAVLAIMRQAAENFNLMKSADEAIALMAEFRNQWDRYSDAFDKLGEQIKRTSEQFDQVRTTRSKMLQKVLDKLEDLRTARDLPVDKPQE